MDYLKRIETSREAVVAAFRESRNYITTDHLEIGWDNFPIRIEYKIRVSRTMRLMPSVASLKKTNPQAVAAKRIEGAGWLFFGSFSYVKDWVQLCGKLVNVCSEEIEKMKIVQVQGHDKETLTGGVCELLEKLHIHFHL